MNVCGIVCEYNPFHNGHLYQIQKTKEAGADAVVCVMSGNFVQRGDFAICKKHARAEAAVMCGADVVFELPVPYAIASAERFAFGAVSLLSKLNVLTSLSFGAECSDVSKLSEAAKLLLSDSLSEEIRENLNLGISYAIARANAVRKVNPSLSALLDLPNNILAIEYIKALIKLSSEISPIAIERKGAGHDEDSTLDGIASASHVRELIKNNEDISSLVPKKAYEIFSREVLSGFAPVFSSDADSAVLAALKRLSCDDFKKYADVSEGLQNRLFDAIASSSTLSDAIDKTKTKRYAHSRIRRIFLNAFLDIGADFSTSEVSYARVLAFNEKGKEVLKLAKKKSSIPIITKPSAINKESKEAQDLFALERRADDIYSLFMKNPTPQGETFTKSPVIL